MGEEGREFGVKTELWGSRGCSVEIDQTRGGMGQDGRGRGQSWGS